MLKREERIRSVVQTLDVATPEKTQEYLKKYYSRRALVLAILGLSSKATIEDVRPKAAQFLGLTAEAPWEEILAEKRVAAVLTDKRRAKYARYFALESDVSWLQIAERVEGLRLQIRKK